MQSGEIGAVALHTFGGNGVIETELIVDCGTGLLVGDCGTIEVFAFTGR